ncbi:hypothetical protein SAMN06265361_103299 [Laceyella tengchongensis]|uniref:Uncharacterized protein n=1 Tax=Laceyella tengchongensis TaxID=574699 RepID=A0AA46AFK2_9BACL|nr:hypothetical protein SAMN06265361_103299 [Laceyella tengchongensis]
MFQEQNKNLQKHLGILNKNKPNQRDLRHAFPFFY